MTEDRQQLGHRVSKKTAETIDQLAKGFGTTQVDVIETAVSTLFEMNSTLSRGALDESEQLAALEVLQAFEIDPGHGRAMDFMRRFAFRILDTMWLATRKLDDHGIPQVKRGQIGPDSTLSEGKAPYMLRIFEGRDADGIWHRGPILISDAAMKAFTASFRKDASVYVDTAIVKIDD